MLIHMKTGKMDNFLEKHNLQNLTQNEIENLNGNIIIKDVDALVKNLSLKDRGWCTEPVLLCLFPDLCYMRLSV